MMRTIKNPAFLAILGIILAVIVAITLVRSSGNDGESRISTSLRDDVENPLQQTVVFGDPNGRSQGALKPAKVSRPPTPPTTRKPVLVRASTRKPTPKKEVPAALPVSRSIMLYRSEVPVSAEDASKLVPVAPPYRMLQCVLTNGIETRMADTPIIAMVTQDLFHDGKVIVPANSEVHGRIRGATNGDRVASANSWDIVLHEPNEDNLRVLKLEGIALDKSVMGKAPDGGTAYGESDGSAGLLGSEIVLDKSNTLKLFTASFLSGFTQNFKQRTTTSFGQTEDIGFGNAALDGTSEVMEQYAKGIQQEIQKGRFVRVPAGTEFYLYVTQSISLGDALPATSGAFSRKAQAIEADRQERALLKRSLTNE